MKGLNKFRFFLIFALICGCNRYESIKVAEKPYVDMTSVELYVGDGAGDRNSIQITSSPTGVQYIWTSLDPTVATVDQTGLITAIEEGFTIITVASADNKTELTVRVRNWVPLVNFELSPQSVIGLWKDRLQIYAFPVPLNASEVNIQWASSDPGVASVSEHGWVTCGGKGNAVITASFAGIQKTAQVVVEPEKLNRSKWTFPCFNANNSNGTCGYSSHHIPGNDITVLLDGDVNTLWHSAVPASDYPHWFIVDLGDLVEVQGVMLQRRQGNTNSASGYYFYTCETEPANQNDPVNGYDWKYQGEYSFNRAIDAEQVQWILPFSKARYVKLYFDTKHRAAGAQQYIMYSEFGLYGRILE